MTIVVAIAAGVVAFLAVVALAYHVRLRDTEAFLGAALAGVLVSLAVGDLLIEELGRWWSARPMFAAAIAGTVLLGLTVVLVDKVLERSRARFWRRVLAQPVAHVLGSLGLGNINDARWAIEKVRWQVPAEEGHEAAWTHRPETEEALSALDAAATGVVAAVNQIRSELLMGGEDAAGIYSAALKASTAAEWAMRRVAQFRDNVTDEDGILFRSGSPYGDYEARARYVISLWTGVRAAYDALAKALHDLQAVALVDFRSELPGEGFDFRIAILTLDDAEERTRREQLSRTGAPP